MHPVVLSVLEVVFPLPQKRKRLGSAGRLVPSVFGKACMHVDFVQAQERIYTQLPFQGAWQGGQTFGTLAFTPLPICLDCLVVWLDELREL